MKTKKFLCVTSCLLILFSGLHLEAFLQFPVAYADEPSSIVVTQNSQGIDVKVLNAFELYFNATNGGEITQYYDLVTDPSCLKNLVLPYDDYWSWTGPSMLPLFSTQFYSPVNGDLASTGQDRNASVEIIGKGADYVILQSSSRVMNKTDGVFSDEEGNPNYVNSTWFIRDDGYIFVSRTLNITAQYAKIPAHYRWYPFYFVRSRGFTDNATFYLFNSTYAYTNSVSDYLDQYSVYPTFPSDENGIFGVAAPFTDAGLGGDGTNNVIVTYDFSEISNISEWRSDNYVGKNGSIVGGTECGATHEFDNSYSLSTNTVRAMVVLSHEPIAEQNVTSFSEYFDKNQVFPLIKTTLSANKQVYEIDDPWLINVTSVANFALTSLTATLTQTYSDGSTTFYENYGIFNYIEGQTRFFQSNGTISNTTVSGNYTFTFCLASPFGNVVASNSETVVVVGNTFGKTTVGTTLSTSYANYTMATQYLMPNSGSVTSVSIWFGNAGFEAMVAIYLQSTGILMVQSQSESILSEGWHNFTIPPTFLLSGLYGLAWKNSEDATVADDPGEYEQSRRTPEPYGNFSLIYGEPQYFDTAVSIYATYTIDNTAPVATINAPAYGSYLKGVVQIKVTGNDINFAKMELQIADKIVSVFDQYDQVYYWRTTAYSDGEYIIKLIVYDKASNVGVTEIPVIIDNTKPSATIAVQTFNDNVKGVVSVNLTGGDANFEKMELEIDDLTSQVWLTSGNHLYEWDTQNYTDGNHNLTFTVRDKAGNVANAIFPTTVDNTPPMMGVPTWQPVKPQVDQEIEVKLSVTDSPSASSIKNVTLLYRDVSLDEWVALEMTLTNGQWTAKIPKQSKSATIEFYVQSCDKAGNIGTTTFYQFGIETSIDCTLILTMLFILVSMTLFGIALYLRRWMKKKALTKQ